MTLKEAKRIGTNPQAHTTRKELLLAHLKLGNAALRSLACSPRQQEFQALMRRIEAMPRELWAYYV